MAAEDRRSYFLRRAQEARTLAEQASDDRVRTIHLEMAIRYELRAEGDVTSGVDDDDLDSEDH